jgi:Ca-activated chloride channel family protein
MTRLRVELTAYLGLVAAAALGVFGFPATSCAQQTQANPGELHLRFLFGSEKQNWLEEVTRRFERTEARTFRGRLIKVDLVPMGSGKLVKEVIAARRGQGAPSTLKPHLISPASEVYIRIGNAEAEGDGGIVGPTQSLVRSPVVIAMWKPLAELLGWGDPDRSTGWGDILKLVNTPEGWAAYDLNKKDFQRFKFTHTHPEYSNSGLIALIAQVYAATHKKKDLTIEDVRRQETRETLAEIAQAIAHYGESTGFLGREMIKGKPEDLHAAVLYENMVIESYDAPGKPKSALPIVAIYPSEGTFWSDHPVGVVKGDWVSNEHQEAAERYISYLRQQPQQELAMKHGFRPGVKGIPLGEKFSQGYGVSPADPSILEVPRPGVVDEILALFRRIKKRANVVLAVDVSNSMSQEGKFVKAKEAAGQIVELLGDSDTLSVLGFGDLVTRKTSRLAMNAAGRREAAAAVRGIKLEGKTRLYDGVLEAYRELAKDAGSDHISLVIVLSDGQDTASKETDIDRLERQDIRFDANKPVFIFTIGYGSDAAPEVLKRIAACGHGDFVGSNVADIREVMEKIAAAAAAGPPRPLAAK